MKSLLMPLERLEVRKIWLQAGSAVHLSQTESYEFQNVVEVVCVWDICVSKNFHYNSIKIIEEQTDLRARLYPQFLGNLQR